MNPLLPESIRNIVQQEGVESYDTWLLTGPVLHRPDAGAVSSFEMAVKGLVCDISQPFSLPSNFLLPCVLRLVKGGKNLLYG